MKNRLFTEEEKAILTEIGLFAVGLYSYVNVVIEPANCNVKYYVIVSKNTNKTFRIFWHDRKAEKYKHHSGITFDETIKKVKNYLITI